MRKNIAFLLSFLVMAAQMFLPLQASAEEDCTIIELSDAEEEVLPAAEGGSLISNEAGSEMTVDECTDVLSDEASADDLIDGLIDSSIDDSNEVRSDVTEQSEDVELSNESSEGTSEETGLPSEDVREFEDPSDSQIDEIPAEEAEGEIAEEEINEEAIPALDDPADDPSLPFTCLKEADGTISITGYTGTAEGDLTIPDKIAIGGTDYTVTVISAEAFKDKTGFTGKLTIPATVTDIRHDAFSGCSNFKSLIFSQGSALTKIGEKAFYNCSGFTNAFSLPDTVTSIGEAAFKNCRGFTGSWSLPASLVTLEKDAFADCCNIGGKLTIPAGVVEIGDNAFYMSNGHYSGWNGVGGLSFAEGSAIERIGKYAFYGNWNLTGGLRFPASLQMIDDSAFESTYVSNNGAGYEGTLTLPPFIKRIGDNAFNICGFSGGLVIPDSLTASDAYLGIGAFDQAGFNGQLTLPAGMKTISEACFRNNGFTGTLNLPDTLEAVGLQAFSGCSKFEGSLVIPESLTTISQGAFGNFGGTGTLTLPSTLTAIESGAFSFAAFTGALNIPDSVEVIGNSAFKDCRGFTSLKLPNNPNFTTIESSAFMVFMTGSNRMGFTGQLVIPDSVTSIGRDAFGGCECFTGQLVLPENLTEIGVGAFSYCKGFTGVTFPDTLKLVGEDAFKYCTGLTGDLKLPNSIKTIGEDAFYSCSNLDGTLTLPAYVEEIGNSAFYACSKLKGRADIPSSVRKLGSEAFYLCTSLEGFSLPSGLESIPSRLFQRCSGMTGELVIPSSVTRINSYAFADCSGLTGGLALSDQLTTIDPGAFSGCSGLTGTLTLPSQLKKIDYDVFKGCSGFTGELSIPESVTSIGDRAFEGCSGFTGRLPITEKVETIGDSAFKGCSGFTGKLIIPESVTSLNYETFRDCTGLTGLEMHQMSTVLNYMLFAGCTGLTGDLEIPGFIKSMYYGVFSGCTGLTGTLTIPDSVTSANRDALYGTKFSTIVNNSTKEFNGAISPDKTYYYVDDAGVQADTLKTGRYTLAEGTPTPQTIDISGASVTAASQTYTGKALTPVPQVTIQGAAMNPSGFEVSYKNNVNAGTATITVTGIESQGFKGTASGTFVISALSVTPSISLEKDSYVYDGKEKKPAVSVKAGASSLKASDYTVSYTSGRKDVGKYEVSVRLKGNYAGSGKASFTIVPKGTKIKKLTAAKKGFTVKWAKQTSQTTGYQIQYAVKANFADAKTVIVKGAKTVSKKIAKLNKKKKYYVRIRTYKKVGTAEYYSEWSAKKSVKTK